MKLQGVHKSVTNFLGHPVYRYRAYHKQNRGSLEILCIFGCVCFFVLSMVGYCGWRESMVVCFCVYLWQGIVVDVYLWLRVFCVSVAGNRVWRVSMVACFFVIYGRESWLTCIYGCVFFCVSMAGNRVWRVSMVACFFFVIYGRVSWLTCIYGCMFFLLSMAGCHGWRASMVACFFLLSMVGYCGWRSICIVFPLATSRTQFDVWRLQFHRWAAFVWPRTLQEPHLHQGRMTSPVLLC